MLLLDELVGSIVCEMTSFVEEDIYSETSLASASSVESAFRMPWMSPRKGDSLSESMNFLRKTSNHLLKTNSVQHVDICMRRTFPKQKRQLSLTVANVPTCLYI